MTIEVFHVFGALPFIFGLAAFIASPFIYVSILSRINKLFLWRFMLITLACCVTVGFTAGVIALGMMKVHAVNQQAHVLEKAFSSLDIADIRGVSAEIVSNSDQVVVVSDVHLTSKKTGESVIRTLVFNNESTFNLEKSSVSFVDNNDDIVKLGPKKYESQLFN